MLLRAVRPCWLALPLVVFVRYLHAAPVGHLFIGGPGALRHLRNPGWRLVPVLGLGLGYARCLRARPRRARAPRPRPNQAQSARAPPARRARAGHPAPAQLTPARRARCLGLSLDRLGLAVDLGQVEQVGLLSRADLLSPPGLLLFHSLDVGGLRLRQLVRLWFALLGRAQLGLTGSGSASAGWSTSSIGAGSGSSSWWSPSAQARLEARVPLRCRGHRQAATAARLPPPRPALGRAPVPPRPCGLQTRATSRASFEAARRPGRLVVGMPGGCLRCRHRAAQLRALLVGQWRGLGGLQRRQVAVRVPDACTRCARPARRAAAAWWSLPMPAGPPASARTSSRRPRYRSAIAC